MTEHRPNPQPGHQLTIRRKPRPSTGKWITDSGINLEAADSVTIAALTPPDPIPEPEPEPTPVGGNILGVDLATLPKSGAAFDRVKALAAKSGTVNYGDIGGSINETLLAKAALNDKAAVLALVRASKGSLTTGINSLAASRNLAATAIALNLVGAHEEDAWLKTARDQKYANFGALAESAMKANNHGSAADQSLVAIDLHLGDKAHLDSVVIPIVKERFGGEQKIKFAFGDTSFQGDPSKPTIIGRVGDVKAGISLDGILAEEQRRQGTFPQLNDGNYNFGASGQLLLTAFLLERAGYGAAAWFASAVKRVFVRFQKEGWKPSGDDSWQGHMVRALYGAGVGTPLAIGDGKTMGLTDFFFP